MTKVSNCIDYTDIKFGEPTKGNDGKYFIKSSNDTNDIFFHLKDLQCKSEIENTFDVRITNENNTDLIREAEDQMLALSKDNKEKWFPDQDITDEYLENAFMSFIKPIKKSTDINFRMRKSSKLTVFDHRKDEIDENYVTEGKAVSCIVHLSGIWFTKSRFGVVWKVIQIKLNKEKEKKICLFEDADDEEYDDMENAFPEE